MPVDGGMHILLPKGANFRVEAVPGALKLELVSFTGTLVFSRNESGPSRPAGSSPGKVQTSPGKSRTSPGKARSLSEGPAAVTSTTETPDGAALRALQDLFPDVPITALTTALRATSGDIEKAADRVIKRQAKHDVPGPQGGSAGKARRGSLRNSGVAQAEHRAAAAPATDAAQAPAPPVLAPAPSAVPKADAVPAPWPALRAPASPPSPVAALRASDPEDAWLLSPQDPAAVPRARTAGPRAETEGARTAPGQPEVPAQGPSEGGALLCEEASTGEAEAPPRPSDKPDAAAAAAPVAALDSPPTPNGPPGTPAAQAKAAGGASSGKRAGGRPSAAAAATAAATAAAAATSPEGAATAAGAAPLAGGKRLRSDYGGGGRGGGAAPAPPSSSAPGGSALVDGGAAAAPWECLIRRLAPAERSRACQSGGNPVPLCPPYPPLVGGAVQGASLSPLATAEGGAAPSARWAHAATATGSASMLLFGGEDSARVRRGGMEERGPACVGRPHPPPFI